jgi:hypothetical protein
MNRKGQAKQEISFTKAQLISNSEQLQTEDDSIINTINNAAGGGAPKKITACGELVYLKSALDFKDNSRQ